MSREFISEVLNMFENSVGVYEAGFTYRTSDLQIVGYRLILLEDETASQTVQIDPHKILL